MGVERVENEMVGPIGQGQRFAKRVPRLDNTVIHSKPWYCY
jgi:hypothetical protein